MPEQQQTTNRLDRLSPDQRAALALIVGQRKSYDDLAGLLGIDEQAVHDRAYAALAILVPRLARELTPEQRELVADHVLGQDEATPKAERARELLTSTPAAREWAQALRVELAPLTGDGPLEVADETTPADTRSANGHHDPVAAMAPDQPAATPAGPRSEPQGRRPVRSSRIGGAILLALLVAGVVVAVVLLTGGGSSHHGSAKNASHSSTAPRVTNQFALQPVEQGSHAAGAVEILQSGSKRAFFMIASHLPPTKGFYYAIWLYNSQSSHEALSRAPAVGSKGTFEGGSFLPENASHFKYILLTRETASAPASPSPHVVLAAAFSVGS